MKTIDILIVIDSAGALASGSLADNAYLVDSNGFLGSWHEGTAMLSTVAQDGNLIQWCVTAVSVSGDVAITGFAGAMVAQGVCQPAMTDGDGHPWIGRVEARGQFASFPYVLTVSVGGKPFSLNAAVKVV